MNEVSKPENHLILNLVAHTDFVVDFEMIGAVESRRTSIIEKLTEIAFTIFDRQQGKFGNTEDAC